MNEPFTLTNENIGEVLQRLKEKLEEPMPVFRPTEEWARICGWSEETIATAKENKWII